MVIMGDPCGKHFLHTFGRIAPECRKLCVSLPYPRVLASYGKSIDADNFCLRMSGMNKEHNFPSLFVEKNPSISLFKHDTQGRPLSINNLSRTQMCGLPLFSHIHRYYSNSINHIIYSNYK